MSATAGDLFDVTAAVTPPNPTTGDTITVTISGDDVLTTISAGTIGPLSLNLTAADGATSTITVPAVPYNLATATHESVKITAVTDPSGRRWTVGSGGLTASAIA